MAFMHMDLLDQRHPMLAQKILESLILFGIPQCVLALDKAHHSLSIQWPEYRMSNTVMTARTCAKAYEQLKHPFWLDPAVSFYFYVHFSAWKPILPCDPPQRKLFLKQSVECLHMRIFGISNKNSCLVIEYIFDSYTCHLVQHWRTLSSAHKI